MPARPSYRGGFAPETGMPRYPELWRGCLFAAAPCLGPSGILLKDLSGFKRHGTLTLMDTATDWAMSRGQYALDFDGTDDYVAIASNFGLSELTSFTVSAWCLPGTAQRGDIFSIGSSASTSQLVRLTINEATGSEDNVSVSFRDDALNEAKYSSGDVNVQDGNWHHFALRWNAISKTVDAYFDGDLLGSATNASITTTTLNQSAIGCLYRTTAALFLRGQVDDVRVVRGLLSQQQISLLASRRGIAYEPEPRRYGKAAAAAALRKRYLTLLGVGN